MDINATLLVQMITFAIFVWFTMKFVWPPIMQAMKEREAKIAEGLAAAERGEQEQQRAEAQAEHVITEAKQQAADIIAQAQKRGNDMLEDAKASATTESLRIKEQAESEVQQELNKAKTELSQQLSTVAIAAAEKILQREVDAKTHKDLLDQFAQQIS